MCCFVFIIPIPSFLLDVMLAFNLSIALIILFKVLFVKEVLDMSFSRHSYFYDYIQDFT